MSEAEKRPGELSTVGVEIPEELHGHEVEGTDGTCAEFALR